NDNAASRYPYSFPTRRSSDLGPDPKVRLFHRETALREKCIAAHGRRELGAHGAGLTGHRELALYAEPLRGRHDRSRGKGDERILDRKSTRLNSSHVAISYAVF